MKKTLLFAACFAGSFSMVQAQKTSPFVSPLGGPKFLEAIEAAWPTEIQRGSLLRQAFNNQYIPDTAFYHGWDDANQNYYMHTKAHFTYGHAASLRRIDYYEVGNNGWEIVTSDTFYYDAANRLTAMETFENGIPVFRMEMNYNANGLLTGRHYMVSQGPSIVNTAWETVLGDSIEIHTTSNNQITSYTLLAASFTWNGWMPMFKASNIQYNAQGTPVHMAVNGYTGTGWSDTVFYNNMRWDFGFGNWAEASNMTNAIEERYSLLPRQELFLKQPTGYTLTQQVNGQMEAIERARPIPAISSPDSVIYEIYTNNAWVAAARSMYTYASGRVTSTWYEEFNGTSFEPIERSVFAFSNNILSESRFELWDAVANGWLVDEGYFYRTLMAQSRPDSIETLVFNPATLQYLPSSLATFSYNTAATVRAVNPGLDMQVWPNPVKETLHLRVQDALAQQGAEVHVIDLQGRLVHTARFDQEIMHGVQLPSDQWPAGMYILQVKAANAHESFRLVKH